MEKPFQIAIIGSGPAGISAAIHASKLGISHIVLEKAPHLSDTVYRYQRGKHVMATPDRLPLRSDASFAASSREQVLEGWQSEVSANLVNIRFGTEVVAISGEKGAFSLSIKDDVDIAAEYVVLAIGTHGNPNLLQCEGASRPWIQYELADSTEYIDENIVVVGAGDAGIENALGLIADPAQNNKVVLLNRAADLSRARELNKSLLSQAQDSGRITVFSRTVPTRVEDGLLFAETPEGQVTLACDRVIARLGANAPRKFLESMGIRFTSVDIKAFPNLSETMETNVSGIYAIGGIAGSPLIKSCLNQGHDVVEYILGNTSLKPPDQQILEKKVSRLAGNRPLEYWIDYLSVNVELFQDLSRLQVRELLLDCHVKTLAPGETLFSHGSAGSSLFVVLLGSMTVETKVGSKSSLSEIGVGSVVGEMSVVSSRPRTETVRAKMESAVLEVPLNCALKLMESFDHVCAVIDGLMLRHLLLELFGPEISTSQIDEISKTAHLIEAKAGDLVIREEDTGSDIFVLRSGSVVVEKAIAGKSIYLNYLAAGSYFGEMALVDHAPRNATVKAAAKSEIICLDGSVIAKLLETAPSLFNKIKRDVQTRREINKYVAQKKPTFDSAADMFGGIAHFLIDQGIGEATDVLLIDESLCTGCDNCERACAESHDGLSRLNREAGRTFSHIHVPTSCRHCEHPYCMADCPPNAIHRGPDGEVTIDQTCIGCGHCERTCPYGVIKMDSIPPKKPGLLSWLLFGSGPGPGEPGKQWREANDPNAVSAPKIAVKCDMCAGRKGGPACVSSCPTGAATRVSPAEYMSVSNSSNRGG